MHGIVHDFVVLNTVKEGHTYPTGNGGGARANELLMDYPTLRQQPIYKKVLDIGSLNINGNMFDYNFVGDGPNWRELIGIEEFHGLDLIDGPGVTQRGNAHDLPYKNDYFDLVMCMSMIEHDTNPLATLKEAYRVLKPGAPFILTTVSAEAEEHKHLGGGDTETYNFITKGEFKRWLAQVGFNQIRIEAPQTELLAYCIK